MARAKKETYYKDDKNRFRLLRYKDNDDLLGSPSITVEEISQKTGLSKGLVAKMEKQQLDEGDIPACNASTIRAYHDRLDCSYEYLMGNSTTKSNNYYSLGTDPILRALPDSFWDNLKCALTDEWRLTPDTVDMERVAVLRLLLGNPNAFKDLLDAIFNSLFEIYKLQKAPLPEYMAKDSIAQREYALDQAFNRFLSENVLPNLTPFYQRHEKNIAKLKEHEDEILADIGQGFLDFINRKNTDTGD